MQLLYNNMQLNTFNSDICYLNKIATMTYTNNRVAISLNCLFWRYKDLFKMKEKRMKNRYLSIIRHGKINSNTRLKIIEYNNHFEDLIEKKQNKQLCDIL